MAVLETTLVYLFALIACIKTVAKRFPGAATHIFGLKIFAAESPTATEQADATQSSCVRRLGLQDVLALARPLDPFSTAVACAFCLAVQSALGEALSRGFGRSSSPWLVTTAALCLGYCLMHGLLPAAAARVTNSGQFQQAQTAFVVVCAIALTLVMSVLLSMPATAIDVSGAGAVGLRDALRFWKGVCAVLIALLRSLIALLRSVSSVADAPERVAADAPQLAEQQVSRALLTTWAICTAMCAGTYCATLVLPLVRFARCTSAALFPSSALLAAPDVTPHAADMPVQPTLVTCLMIRLAVAAPPLACLLWVQPLVAAFAQHSDAAAAALQAMALVLCGILHLAVVRPLLQSYFSSALLRWCQLKCKDSVAKPAAPLTSQAHQAVRAAIGNTNALFPSVLVQLTMPGIVMVVAGLLLWDAAAWGRAVPAYDLTLDSLDQTVHASVLHFVNPPRGLVQTSASVLGLSALFTHSMCVSGLLALGRFGVIE